MFKNYFLVAIRNIKINKGYSLLNLGSNEIWYAAVLVTPKLDRAFVVATNSCDFGSTPGICTEIMNKLIRMELNISKE